MARIITLTGVDGLTAHRISVDEALGQLFDIRLEVFSKKQNIQLDDVLGKSITLKIDFPENITRYFNGIATQFGQIEKTDPRYSWYEIQLRPWTWLLTRTADCKIFQQKKVPEIIKTVLQDMNFSDFKVEAAGTYREWEYCVQYAETAFNFISRLMEHEGMYYYFEHGDGVHTMLITDPDKPHEPIAGDSKVRYLPPDQAQTQEGYDAIYNWRYTGSLQSGSYATNAFDFEKPDSDLNRKNANPQQHNHANFPVYHYPGNYILGADGQRYAEIRMEELHVGYELIYGTGNVPGLAVGAEFELSDYPRKDQNKKYLISQAKHEFVMDVDLSNEQQQGLQYTCNFSTFPSTQRFRSPQTTPKPRIRGPQTAIVVGKSEEEIWTDEHARVKVQFHWDRVGENDENSSCWIRVAQAWAGHSWGSIHIPRIGQEVVVEFLEGDPDRPIITGRVYNGKNKVPYNLPDNQTQSGVLSRSTKKGNNKTANELRFEDKIEEEEIYFHAEKNFKRVVENDDSLEVGCEKKDPGSQTIQIHKDRTVTLDTGDESFNVDKGSQTIKIHKDRTVTLETGDESFNIDKGSQTIKIHKDRKVTLETGNESFHVATGKSEYKAAQSIKLTVGGSSILIEPTKISIQTTQIEIKAMEIGIKGGSKVDLEAPITTAKGNVSLILKGGMVKIN